MQIVGSFQQWVPGTWTTRVFCCKSIPRQGIPAGHATDPQHTRPPCFFVSCSHWWGGPLSFAIHYCCCCCSLPSRLRVQNAGGLCWLQHPDLRPLPPEGEWAFVARRLLEVRRLPAGSLRHLLLSQPAAVLQAWLWKVSAWHLLISTPVAWQSRLRWGMVKGKMGPNNFVTWAVISVVTS